MNNSPSVIFNCGYVLPSDSSQKNDFYRCKKNDFNVIEYLDRKGASDKLSDENIEKIKSFIEDTNMSENSIIGYANNRQGSTGIFTKDRENNLQKIAEKLNKTDSIIWHSVLSFTPEIAQKYCSNKRDAEKLLHDNLPSLFKSKYGENAPLKYDNIDWFAAYHTNTDNRHIHLVFWEKEPKVLDRNGNVSFRKTGRIDNKHFDEFKGKVVHYFTQHNLDYLSMRDEIRRDISSAASSDKKTFDELLRRSQSILTDGHFQYARLDGQQKKTIDKFVKFILNKNPDAKKKYEDYKKDLANTQADYLKMYADNRIQPPYNVSTFYSTRLSELNNRLGNELLKQLKGYAFKKQELEKLVGYKNGVWEPSKLSPKNRKAIISKELSRVANSALNLFFAEAIPTIEGQRLSDKEYRRQLKMEGKELIYE